MSKERGLKYTPDTKFVVHPDMKHALQNYTGQESMDEALSMRDVVLDRGGVYWDTDHDEEMLETARERTQVASAAGWHFPPSPKKR
jgi:hypothetical protein